jgi:predicted kinase
VKYTFSKKIDKIIMSKVHLVFGSQGAGKSTYSKRLAEEINGVHLSIDEWMWELYGADLPKPINVKWIMERVERCEKQIWTTAKQISACNGNVILDLGFMKVKNRDTFLELAKDLKISTQLHYIDALYPIRFERVMKRNIKKGQTFSFEVTPEMFEFMDKEFEKPSEKEMQNIIMIDTN